MDYIQRIQRAIDYIEESLKERISLDEVARQAYLSPYHFHRVFHGLVGLSPGEYIRKRRLTIAAIQLLENDLRIIDIAFDVGFESQESFTRAFKKQFGYTPAKYRAKMERLSMFAKKRLTETGLKHLEGGLTMQPKIVTKEEFKVIGLQCRTNQKDNKVPALWQKFCPRMGEVKNRINPTVSYGICFNEPGFDTQDFTEETEFTELVSVEVESFDHIPKGMVTRTVPTQKYAVFTHKGELANLRMTYDYIYGTWLPHTDYELARTDDFEYYDERFNAMDQKNSEFDIYVPIK